MYAMYAYVFALKVSSRYRLRGFMAHMSDLKVVVVGDGAVGKTYLQIRFAIRMFPRDYVPNIFDKHAPQVLRNNKTYTLSLWDTGECV